MPKIDPEPAGSPGKKVPLEGKLVSLPSKAPASKFAYPAYGESLTTPSSFAADRTVVSTKKSR
jgi:hypothetical protein